MATLKSTRIASNSSKHASKTSSSTMPLSGPTYVPSTVSCAEEWWTSLRHRSPASRIAAPTRPDEVDLTSGTYGPTPYGSFGTWHPATSSWRMSEGWLTATTPTLRRSLGNFPRQGTMRDGVCYPLPRSERRTSANAGGVWRWMTPNTFDALPPKSQKALDYEHNTARRGRKNPNNLRDQVAAPPRLRLWPTPTATSYGTGNNYKANEGQPATHRPSLQTMARRAGGLLNSRWVEWLMGVPIGWVSLKPLAMESYRQWQRGFSTHQR